MPYLWSVVVVIAAVITLGLVVATLLGPIRRFGVVAGVARQEWERETGMLTARSAALGVRLEQRRTGSINGTVGGATP